MRLTETETHMESPLEAASPRRVIFTSSQSDTVTRHPSLVRQFILRSVINRQMVLRCVAKQWLIVVQCFLHSNRSASFSIFLSQVLTTADKRSLQDSELPRRSSNRTRFHICTSYQRLCASEPAWRRICLPKLQAMTSPYFYDSEPRHCKPVRRGIANFSLCGRCFMSYGCAGYKQRKLTNLSGPIVVGRGASLPKRIAHSQDGAAKLETTKNPRIVD